MIINDTDSSLRQTLNATIWPENNEYNNYYTRGSFLGFGGYLNLFTIWRTPILFPKESHGQPLVLASETAPIYAYLLGDFPATELITEG